MPEVSRYLYAYRAANQLRRAAKIVDWNAQGQAGFRYEISAFRNIPALQNLHFHYTGKSD